MRYQSDKIGLIQASGTQFSETFTSTMPRLTVDYRFSDNAMMYFTVAKGNKPGVFNTDPTLPPDARLAEEEEAWNYEIGTKWDSADGRSRANAAVFFIDWSNQQLTNSILVAGVPISFVSNAGKTEVWGVEVEGSRLISDRWEVRGSIGYNNAEFTENCDPVRPASIAYRQPVFKVVMFRATRHQTRPRLR